MIKALEDTTSTSSSASSSGPCERCDRLQTLRADCSDFELLHTVTVDPPGPVGCVRCVLRFNIGLARTRNWDDVFAGPCDNRQLYCAGRFDTSQRVALIYADQNF